MYQSVGQDERFECQNVGMSKEGLEVIDQKVRRLEVSREVKWNLIQYSS